MVPSLHLAEKRDEFTLNLRNSGKERREIRWKRALEENMEMNLKKLIAHLFCRAIMSTGGFCACMTGSHHSLS